MAGRKKTQPKPTPKNEGEFVDYRFSELHDKVDDVKTELKGDIKDLRDEVHTSFQTINDKLDNTFATKDYVDNGDKDLGQRIALVENDNVLLKKIVYGAVGLILVSFMLAVVGLVIIKKNT